MVQMDHICAYYKGSPYLRIIPATPASLSVSWHLLWATQESRTSAGDAGPGPALASNADQVDDDASSISFLTKLDVEVVVIENLDGWHRCGVNIQPGRGCCRRTSPSNTPSSKNPSSPTSSGARPLVCIACICARVRTTSAGQTRSRRALEARRVTVHVVRLAEEGPA